MGHRTLRMIGMRLYLEKPESLWVNVAIKRYFKVFYTISVRCIIFILLMQPLNSEKNCHMIWTQNASLATFKLFHKARMSILEGWSHASVPQIFGLEGDKYWIGGGRNFLKPRILRARINNWGAPIHIFPPCTINSFWNPFCCVYCVDTYVVVWAQFGRSMYTRILISDFSVFRTFTSMPINGLNIKF